MDTLIARGWDLIVAEQSLWELWAVATRPKDSPNGWGLSTSVTRAIVERTRRAFQTVSITGEVFAKWLDLVTLNELKGRIRHDARLAAAAFVYDIPHLLTFNTTDFTRFGLILLNPADVSNNPKGSLS